MHIQTRTGSASLGSRVQEVSRSVAGAVALASLGVVAEFASVLVVDPLYAIVEAEWTLFGELVDRYVIQPGFGLVVADNV